MKEMFLSNKHNLVVHKNRIFLFKPTAIEKVCYTPFVGFINIFFSQICMEHKSSVATFFIIKVIFWKTYFLGTKLWFRKSCWKKLDWKDCCFVFRQQVANNKLDFNSLFCYLNNAIYYFSRLAWFREGHSVAEESVLLSGIFVICHKTVRSKTLSYHFIISTLTWSISILKRFKLTFRSTSRLKISSSNFSSVNSCWENLAEIKSRLLIQFLKTKFNVKLNFR